MKRPGETTTLAKIARLRSYKPGKYGKGLIQSEQAPQAMVWRIGGGWNGEPHHAEVSEVLKIHTPNVAFHIAKDARFYFHSEDQGFVHPKDPAALAAHVRRQYPKLRWGRVSAEEYERANGMREAKTLALHDRPLRAFEQGAHLHVLDWTHSTVRQRFQAAGAVQVKAASKVLASSWDKANSPPQLPSLEAAITLELRKLYALGHATVRSELDHQRQGRALPVGLSKAPEPPGLRTAKAKKGYFAHCANCEMFDASASVCWGYGNWPVKPGLLCDSYARDPQVKTLALDDERRDPGQLRARARLVSQATAQAIWQAIGRGRLQGITDDRELRKAGREAGEAALAQAASHHAGGALNAGRHAAATNGNAEVVGARYTSVLDKSSCQACRDADDGVLRALGDPALVHPPNPACAGGDRCRCILVYQLASEAGSGVLPVPAAA